MRNFHHTVNVLVQAYLNDTLIHGDCAACAVGNIISESIGAKIIIFDDNEIFGYSWIRNGDEITVGWTEVFVTKRGEQEINPKKYLGQIKRQIDASGYSWRELAMIESAFESAGRYDEKWNLLDKHQSMFDGLMAVVNVLADIHGIPLDQVHESKKLFVKI